MPAKPRWLLAIPDAIRQLESLDRELLTRRDLERLFGVSKVRAAQLMTTFGAGRTGHLLTLPRAELLRQLRRQRKRAAFRQEKARREKVLTEIRRARLTGLRVAAPVEAIEARLAALPEGVSVESGRIEVRYQDAPDAVTRLFALAQALTNDYERFEALVAREERSMFRQEQVIVVLVASPSDLEPERNQLEDVIRELNASWSRSLGVRLELVRWETHGYPGMGHDPQDVLNRELPDDPDIFIGIMWSRYGTETGRAGSGTEEEFNQALARHRQNPDSVRIMFYFKDAPLAPSDIDLDQLSRVVHFRESLGSEGALYWTFRTLDEFERLLRMHLSRQIQHLAEPSPPPAATEPRLPAQHASTESDELGLLDFLDLVDEHFGALRHIAVRITTETETIGENMRTRTAEMEEATSGAHGQLSRRQARSVIERAAADMNQYVARMSAEIPLFRESLQSGADAAGRAVLLSASIDASDTSSASDARQRLVQFLNSLINAYSGMESFKSTVQGLPRMTSVLNRAKRETAMVLQDLLDSMAEGRRIVTETIRMLDVILGNGPARRADECLARTGRRRP